MRTEPVTWSSDDRTICEWTLCTRARWAPYSWDYCAYHFAKNANLMDRERKQQDLPPIAVTWARSRFCGVLNGYTPELGDVAWDTHYPREELAHIAENQLNLQLSPIKETQWRIARGKAAAGYVKKRLRGYRTPPIDYEGPGSRQALSRSASLSKIDSPYDGESRTNR